MNNTVPNPGSIEARDDGCTCPVLDNEFGDGDGGSFYITQGCPLHDQGDFSGATEDEDWGGR